VFRVAIAARAVRVIAAICASKVEIGHPERRRWVAICAQARAGLGMRVEGADGDARHGGFLCNQ
jgi:hypothetical protein